ncbi:RNA polymerase II-associated protein 1 [Neocloeon triangulifer]|uniref:RNA polymerase II-associated protein 1 n=1 Tax=Neocloeon triangulifer TaxID=2078957 RepID=UPI00286F9E90|nr:RNA polymerase II-associated protein 1 [Neocloeon triangulifer]
MSFRPKVGETDEDLIRQNAEFLKNVKRKVEETDKAALEGDLKKQKAQECGTDCIFNDPEVILNSARVPGIMLSDIVERTPSAKPFRPPVATTSGFPVVFKRDKLLSQGDTKKLSIFAKMHQRKSQQGVSLSASEEINLGAQTAIKNVFGPSEAQKIHEESLQKLSQLSEEQILEERKRLLASLNPETLKFFTNRQKGKGAGIGEEPLKPTQAQPKEEKMLEDQPIPEEDLPIPIEEAKKWLHMDVVENEKLKWMKKLPAPKPLAPGDPHPARFDFEGNLMPVNADVPETKALHHHGEEPERAGYTLEELLLFSRSSVMQQRAIGVSTIANILRLAKEGRFDLCLEESIIPQLVSAGLFAVLRFSLDDAVMMVVQAAAEALNYLLASEPDEVCLSLMLGTTFGLQQPILACPPEPEEEKEKGQTSIEEGELRDHELLQLDVIKGALRTDLVPRIRYLLEIIKPGPKTTLSLIEILIRIARHSRESALAIGRCPGLMQTIISQFLPLNWESTTKKPADMESVRGVPLARAVRLIRIISAQSKAMSLDFINKFNIMTPIMAYLASEPGETGIPDGPAILIESFYLWQTFLAYDLGINEFSSFSPVYGQLLSFHLTNTNLRTEGSFYQEHATAILTLLSAALNVNRMHHDKLPRELLIQVGPPIVKTTASWITQAAENLPMNFSDCKLVGAALSVSKQLFLVLQYWDGVDTMSWMSLVQNVTNSSVIPFISSKTFESWTNSMLEHSSLLDSESTSGRKRDPKGLPSTGSVTYGQRITSILQPGSPSFAVQSIIAFLNFTVDKFPMYKQAIFDALLKSKGVQSYINKIAINGCPGFDHWFSRTEIHLSADLLNIATKSENLDSDHQWQCHRAAMNLISCIRIEDRSLITQLFNTWIFYNNQEETFLSLMQKLNLQDNNTKSPLLEIAINELPMIRDAFLVAFKLNFGTPISSKNTISLPAENDSLLPVDWPFLPLVKVVGHVQEEKKVENKTSAEEHPPADLSEVFRSLQWIFILETLEPQVLNKMLSPTARLCRLACVFLAENCIFLEKNISDLLKEIVGALLKNQSLCGQDFDFDEKIPGLKDFWDLYVQLVQQYSAESYGDKLFAHFILIPLQQRFSVSFKNLIWGELVEIVRFLSLPIEELMIPIENFLEPLETNVALLELYLKTLRSGLVKPSWSPLLYKLSTHQIVQYIKQGEDRQFAAKLKFGLTSGSNELSSLID